MLELFLAEFKRSWIEFIRYPAEAIGIIITTAIFYGLFLSTRYIAGPALQFGDRLDVVGFGPWYSRSWTMPGLQYEAQVGTLGFPLDFGALKVF